MSKRVTFEVSPHGKGGWQVIKQGAKQATSRHDTKAKATEAGVAAAKKHHPWGQLIIKKMDGKIQDERTYGNDPRDTPG